MPMNAVYRNPGDLAAVIPVFPLPGALLLPRGQMPLNIFEPRYVAMIDDSLRGHRLIGMIQPDDAHPGPESKPNLYKIGCVGRITQIAETGDGLCPLHRRFHRPQGRGRCRPRGPAAGAIRFSQGQRSQGRLGGHRKRAQRSAGQCARNDVTLWDGREAGAVGSARSQDPRRDPDRGHRDRACQEDIGRRNAPAMKALVSRFRSSQGLAAHSRANFGI